MDGSARIVATAAEVCFLAALALVPVTALAQSEEPMTFAPGADNTNEFAKRVVIDHFVLRIYAVGVISETRGHNTYIDRKQCGFYGASPT